MYALLLAATMNASIDVHHIVHVAASKYYNLTARHIPGFRADVHPLYPFDSTADQKTVARFVNATYIVTDRSGRLTFNYLPASPTDDLRALAGFDGIFRNLQQQVTSNLDVWSLFCGITPWPPPGTTYNVERRNGMYTIAYALPVGTMKIVMNGAFVITELDTNSGDTVSTVKPAFKATSKGLVPVAFDWTYTTGSSTTHVTARISYTTIDGEPFPSRFDTKTDRGATSITGGFDLDHVGLLKQ